MNRTALLAIASLAVAPSLHAYVVGKTTPVGIVKLGDTTLGEPSVQASTDVYISIPFLKPLTLTGEISSRTGATVTLKNLKNPDGTTGSAASLPGPHYLVIESGSKAGLIALVDTGTTTTSTVTVSTQPDDSLTGIAADDEVSLRPAWTISSLMGFGLPNRTQLHTIPSTPGVVGPAADCIYEFSGTDWIETVDTGAPANDAVLYPNEAFIVRTPNTPIEMLTASGELSQIPSRIYLLQHGTSDTDNAFSYFGSFDEPILSSGITSVASYTDQIYTFDNSATGYNKSAFLNFEFDGTDWVDTSITGDPIDSSVLFEAGKGYNLRRKSSSTPATVLWSDLPDYLPLD